MKKNICLVLLGWLLGVLFTIMLLEIVPFYNTQPSSQETLGVDSCAVDYNDPYYNSDAFKEEMTMGVGSDSGNSVSE